MPASAPDDASDLLARRGASRRRGDVDRPGRGTEPPDHAAGRSPRERLDHGLGRHEWGRCREWSCDGLPMGRLRGAARRPGAGAGLGSARAGGRPDAGPPRGRPAVAPRAGRCLAIMRAGARAAGMAVGAEGAPAARPKTWEPPGAPARRRIAPADLAEFRRALDAASRRVVVTPIMIVACVAVFAVMVISGVPVLRPGSTSCSPGRQ